jgi:alpha/beta superfamily hydrolase
MTCDALAANVLLFDFRSHGDSDGHTISLGRHERLDVLAAVHYLRAQRAEQARTVMAYAWRAGWYVCVPGVQCKAFSDSVLPGLCLAAG